jgi:hypothetical protein
MPQVGNKHFPYTPGGEAAAKSASKKSGKPVKNKKPGKRYNTATNTFQ